MNFDRQLYLREMQQLVAIACVRLAVQKPRMKIYTVSIWTDPDARASTISFDTRAHSRQAVASAERYRKRMYVQLLRDSDREMARLFAKPTPPRETNPADFALRSFYEVANRSFPVLWAERSKGRCWTELEPALRDVVKMVLPILQELRLERDAVVGVNGSRDWFQRTRRIGGK